MSLNWLYVMSEQEFRTLTFACVCFLTLAVLILTPPSGGKK